MEVRTAKCLYKLLPVSKLVGNNLNLLGQGGTNKVSFFGLSAALVLKKWVKGYVLCSLCGNTGAVAQLIVNGEPQAQGDLTRVGSSLQIEAQPGDRVVATVNTIPLDNGIVCVRLGELHFVLEVRPP